MVPALKKEVPMEDKIKRECIKLRTSSAKDVP